MEEYAQDEIRDITNEVLEHMMSPKNYGKIDGASGVGMGIDPANGEFALMYLDIDENQNIKDIKFSCNACQDTVIAGSMFTEMVKGESLDYGIKSASLMSEKIKSAPPKQQACSGMVIKAFDAAALHVQDKKSGSNEEMKKLELDISCEGVDNKEK
ncbi:MAG: iron-sulfur cluster assembly scaffold protein [Campylobacteraceae bacterium]|nr:iron-sulfur cluster assembly scaffold protein [Campylobacteraceae bacterium]